MYMFLLSIKVGGLMSILADFRREAWYTLGMLPIYSRAVSVFIAMLIFIVKNKGLSESIR